MRVMQNPAYICISKQCNVACTAHIVVLTLAQRGDATERCTICPVPSVVHSVRCLLRVVSFAIFCDSVVPS